MRHARLEPPAGTPAPKAYTEIGPRRIVIEVLCPERAMAHFTFGAFRSEEADAVRVVHCPICGKIHALVSAAEWVDGVAAERGRHVGLPGRPLKEGPWKIKIAERRPGRARRTLTRSVGIREGSRRTPPSRG
jgi:hypothetical protein